MQLDNDIIEDIKKEIGQIKTEKAEMSVEDNRVKIEGIDLNWDYEIVTLKAQVLDDTSKVNYVQIRLNLKSGGTLYAHNCSCHPYSYKNCEHVLAVLLEFTIKPKYLAKIKEAIENDRKENEKMLFNNIIEKFKREDNIGGNKIEEETENVHNLNTNIDIVPMIRQNKKGEYELSFKFGENKMYKLKSFEEFYENFVTQKVFRYGENLAFKHVEENFTRHSKDFLKFMLKYGEAISFGNMLIENRGHHTESKISSASLLLKGQVLEDFFSILKEKKYMIDFEGSKQVLNFLETEGNLKFELEETNEEEYRLSIKKETLNVLNGVNKIYTIVDSNVYEYDKNKYNDAFKLLSMFDAREKTEFNFSKNELIGFVNNVLPRIRDNVSLDNLSQEVVEKYIPKKLGVRIYLDLTSKGDVLATLKFRYEEIEFEPLSNKIPNIPRDMVQEKRIINKFYEDGFVYSNNYESFILKEEEKIYKFITSAINYYMQKYEVLISEEFKKREIRQPKLSSLGVRIESDILNIDLSGLEFEPEELRSILEKYKLKKKYHRLKNGDFLSLESNSDLEFIENLAEGIEVDFKSLSKGKIRIPVNRSLYLNKLLDNIKNVEITEDKTFKEIVMNAEKGQMDEEIIIPSELENILRLYQKTGYKWLKVLDKYKFGGILADDMGLGKTLQVIAIFLDYQLACKNNENDALLGRLPSIVVSPSSLTLNWQNEIAKFCPSLKTSVIRGTLKERKRLIRKIKEQDVVITSYDLLKRDIDLYIEEQIKFKYIVADEAQYIKNSNTQNARSLKDLSGETRFALTGTPIENSLAELWSIFDYIMPGYLFSYSKFKREYETRIVKDESEEVMNRLKTMIEPFILRRTKSQVLTELPDKTITIMKNEMEEEQEKIYLSYVAQIKQEIMQEIEVQGFEKSQIKILSLLTRLRQICCHPALFIDNYQGQSSKLIQALELIDDGIASGHKILLFSTYTSMFDIIEKYLKEKNIQYYKLTGSTKVDERIRMVDEFNKNSNIKIFLISLKAGGTGLNLTGADMVIHYDPWWNLSAENQATDRAYRIGQKNNVQVYKLITKNSIEEKINELQEKKAALIDNVLDTNQTFINKLSKEDILELFS